jgi:hypothetical protein
LSDVVVSSPVALTPTPLPANEEGLYEWSAQAPLGAPLSLINVLPGEGGVASAAAVGSGGRAAGAISDDGERVVWQTTEPPEEHLYVRDVLRGETVQLDVPGAGAGHTNPVPRFQFASSDGSRVFFTDGQRLAAGSGENDLYECLIVEGAGGLECVRSDLTPLGEGGAEAKVQGVLGASEDGSWVYFTANGVLAPGAVPGECVREGVTPTAGARCNVYVRHDGVTRLVAVVSAGDLNDWNESLTSSTSRVSPDGEWLEFMSQARLTGYDNRDVASGHADQEVFLYHASTGSLVCVSCDPSGARPVGRDGLPGSLVGSDDVWGGEAWVSGLVPGWTPFEAGNALFQSRFLSDSGRLFFDSDDALVSGDVDGTEDVYEYEPVGVGGCGLGAVSSSVVFKGERGFVGEGGVGVEGAGCVGLISSGSGSEESAFLDASGDGSDVFFLTQARLSAVDTDTALDVYDAHVCSSGSPCVSGVVAAPVCASADACRAAPSPEPEVFGAPATATFSGPGNFPNPPAPPPPVRVVKCAKGKKLSHGKCVKAKPKPKPKPKPKRKRGKGERAGKSSRGKVSYGADHKVRV